jgi:beta-glucosidase
MLREVLTDEWGFDGLVMSDWYAARSTEPAANAGLDLVMHGPDGPWGERLVAAVRDGHVPEAAVDAKVLRLLPQPEGPTNTMKPPSGMSRVTPFTARTPPA